MKTTSTVETTAAETFADLSRQGIAKAEWKLSRGGSCSFSGSPGLETHVLLKGQLDKIARHPFFKDFPPGYIPLLSRYAASMDLPAHHEIFLYGEPAEHFYLIVEGEVVLETPFLAGRGIVMVDHLGPEDALGWSWFFPPFVWHFSAHTTMATEVIIFEAEGLRALAQENHDFGYELSRRIAGVVLERLQAAREQYVHLFKTHHDRGL